MGSVTTVGNLEQYLVRRMVGLRCCLKVVFGIRRSDLGANLHRVVNVFNFYVDFFVGCVASDRQ